MKRSRRTLVSVVAGLAVASLGSVLPAGAQGIVARDLTVVRTAGARWAGVIAGEPREYVVSGAIEQSISGDVGVVPGDRDVRTTAGITLEIRRCAPGCVAIDRLVAPAGPNDPSPLIIDPTLEYGLWEGEVAGDRTRCTLRVEWGLKSGTANPTLGGLGAYTPPQASFDTGARASAMRMRRWATARATGSCVPHGLRPDLTGELAQTIRAGHDLTT